MSKSLEEIKIIANQVIESGHLEGKGEDDVKMEMFAQGVPFSKLNSLYKAVSIELGHLVDPKLVTEGLNELIKDIPWDTYEEWEEVESAVSALVDAVDGATSGRALSLIRTYCRNEEVSLPRKPKASSTGSGGRTSKLANAVVDLVISTENPTKQDAYDVVFPLTSGKNQHKNAMYYVNSVFSVALASRKGVALSEVVKELASQAEPADPGIAETDIEAEADMEGDFGEE